MDLSQKEKDEIVTSIHLRLGFIETGTLLVRANDAINMGKQNYIKKLTQEQRKLIIELEGLVCKLQK